MNEERDLIAKSLTMVFLSFIFFVQTQYKNTMKL